MKLRFFLRICTCLLIGFVTPTTSWAQPQKGASSLADSLKGEARTAYRLGVVLYDDGDWPGALGRFETAHRLSGDARLLWNMAVCEKNRRRYTHALAFVDTYLAAKEIKLQPRERRDAKAFRDTVEKLTRLVTLTVNEDGALVTIDGEKVGTTPLPGEIRLNAGEHDVVVQKKSFVEQKLRLSTEGGWPPLITLARDEGRLVVKATPPSASITLNGEHVGHGRFDGSRLIGPASLRISATGMRTYQDEILITRGDTRMVDVTLEPASSRRMWAWIGAGALVLGAAAITGYFVANPTVERPPIQEGSWDTVLLGR